MHTSKKITYIYVLSWNREIIVAIGSYNHKHVHANENYNRCLSFLNLKKAFLCLSTQLLFFLMTACDQNTTMIQATRSPLGEKKPWGRLMTHRITGDKADRDL